MTRGNIVMGQLHDWLMMPPRYDNSVSYLPRLGGGHVLGGVFMHQHTCTIHIVACSSRLGVFSHFPEGDILYLPECREILWFSDGSAAAAGYGGDGGSSGYGEIST